MDFDRDQQGSTGDDAGTGDRSAAGESSASDRPVTPRDPPAGDREQSGSFGASTHGDSSPGTGAFDALPDDAGTRAGSYDRKFTGEDEAAKQRVSEKVGRGRERLSSAVDAGRNRVAGQLERMSDRLEERGHGMEQGSGVQQRASHVALRAGEALDMGAEYLRSHDPDEMRDDLEQSIRERPLLSVGIALGAGFLLARLLRD